MTSRLLYSPSLPGALAAAALAATPSERLAGACAGAAVVVRVIPMPKHGTWLSVGNTGLAANRAARICLPRAGRLIDAATGAPVVARDLFVELDLGPCELRSLHLAE